MLEIYGSPKCTVCKMVKDYLDKKGVSYRYHDISEHPDIADRAKELGLRALPIIAVEDGLMCGFNKKELDEVIG